MVGNIKGLMTFHAVVHHGSFSAAARHLKITPGAVSRAIARLEAGVGVRLFNRSTSEFSLTSEGKRLAVLTNEKVSALSAAIDDFCADSDRPSGALRISLTNSYGKHYVIPNLPIFLAKYPEIKLEIAFDDSRLNLIEDGFDVGICYGVPDESSYFSRVVCRPQLALLASPSYLARKGVPQTPGDLEAHDCINVHVGTHGPAVWLFHRRDQQGSGLRSEAPTIIHPNALIMLSEQIDGVIQAAVAGIGVTAAHVHAALPHLMAGDLKVLLPDYELGAQFGTRDVHVFFPHREQIAPRVRAFVDFLINDVRETPVDCTEFAA